MYNKNYESSEICNFCKIIDPISIIHAAIYSIDSKFPSEISSDIQQHLDRIQRSIDRIIEHVNSHQIHHKQ